MVIKIPRVRISDCARLIFRLGRKPEWRDIDLDSDLFPIWPLPRLPLSSYTFDGRSIKITPGETINDLAREICKIRGGEANEFLHTITLDDKTGVITISTEKI